jgi:hemerythrin
MDLSALFARNAVTLSRRRAMAVQWTSDLSVGVQEIDGQHQMLFKRLNDFLEACTQWRGKEMVVRVLLFLENYVSEHFAAEETLMLTSGYPGSARHRREHQQFVGSLTELKKELDADGPSAHLVVAANAAVLEWLQTHIRNVDKAFGAFLMAKN